MEYIPEGSVAEELDADGHEHERRRRAGGLPNPEAEAAGATDGAGPRTPPAIHSLEATRSHRRLIPCAPSTRSSRLPRPAHLSASHARALLSPARSRDDAVEIYGMMIRVRVREGGTKGRGDRMKSSGLWVDGRGALAWEGSRLIPLPLDSPLFSRAF